MPSAPIANGVVTHTRMTPNFVSIMVDLPVPLDLTKDEAIELENNLETAVITAIANSYSR
jgi:hypothetical protein